MGFLQDVFGGGNDWMDIDGSNVDGGGGGGIWGTILQGLGSILPTVGLGGLASLFGAGDNDSSGNFSNQLSSNIALANQSIADAQAQVQHWQNEKERGYQAYLSDTSGRYETPSMNSWGYRLYQQAQANLGAAQSNVSTMQRQMDEFNQAQELYNSPAELEKRMKGMSDASGLTNSIANAGAGALTNAFGNLLRGGAPTESGGTGTPLEGFRMQEIPGIDAPEWGSGSNQFAQGKGPSTKSGNYGDVTNLLGQLFNQSGRKWDLPDRDQQEDPNLNYQMFDMPNPTFGYEGGMSAAPGQASASGMTGLSTMPMNPGVGQGGISLGGQGFAGGFGDKKSSMNGMFPQQPGFSGSMKF